MSWMSARCKSCRAHVVWARSINGKLMPVDAMPSPQGQWRLALRPGTQTPTALHIPESERATHDELYVAHWATCPNADKHRKAT